jgi:preprotein translocase subunit YajC
MTPILIIAILIAIGYVLLVRPSQRRSRSHSAMQAAVEPGDEIISAGGIHGLVKETTEEEVQLEIAPGVIVTLDRRAIAAVAVPEEPEDAAEPEEAEEPAEAPSEPAKSDDEDMPVPS